MSQIQKLQGIVIKKTDYKENANIITLLTKEGKVSLIVRGAKKINSVMKNYTNLFSKLEVNATSNLKLNTLTEGIILNSYANIITNPDKLNVGMVIMEKVNLLSEGIQDNNLFYEFISLTLDKLNETSFPYGILAVFELKLLYLLGVSPELKECVICGNKDIETANFSIENGGIICKNHMFNNYNLNITETNALKLLYFIKPDKVDDNFLKLVNDYINPISDVIDTYYQRHLDFHSKAKKILKRILK